MTTSSGQALRVYQENGKVTARLENVDLPVLDNGEVLIQSEYSSLNYKDALAITGRGKILKSFPLIAGIDVAGKVFDTKDPKFAVGQKVLVTGCGLGESFDGGYSTWVKVSGEHVVPVPTPFSTYDVMALGTAGFTAGLCLARMEANGQNPHKGPILVTGASGGVGGIAVRLLASKGYEVMAVSSKPEARGSLIARGAQEVLSPSELNLGQRPLESAKWAGAIDNLGGEFLSGIIPHIGLYGNVASVGLASGHELNGTVMPFILRGVSLLGISSANCPMKLRKEVWQDLAATITPQQVAEFVSAEISLNNLPATSEKLLDRQIWGRTVVKLN